MFFLVQLTAGSTRRIKLIYMTDRVTINLTGLRERIENAVPNSLWKELSLARKIKILLQERLEQIEQEQQNQKNPSPAESKGE